MMSRCLGVEGLVKTYPSGLDSQQGSIAWFAPSPRISGTLQRLPRQLLIRLRDRNRLWRCGLRLGARAWRLLRRMPEEPLISCLCITRDRVDLLARAIRCFQAQSWANRELLIVYESDDAATRAFLNTLVDPLIRVIEVSVTPKRSLGELRNLAVERARGRWFCQWDDDDWHHCERLAAQWSALRSQRQVACVMMHWLVFDSSTGRAFISPRWHWEGSILCDREALSGKLRYASMARGEDTPFVQALVRRGEIAQLFRPGLYIYVYHRRNVWDYAHWRQNILERSSLALDAADAERIAAIIDGVYSETEGSAVLDGLLERIDADWRT